jgi:hypothetical protein
MVQIIGATQKKKKSLRPKPKIFDQHNGRNDKMRHTPTAARYGRLMAGAVCIRLPNVEVTRANEGATPAPQEA